MLPRREDQFNPLQALASGRLTRDLSCESTLRSETNQTAKSKYDATPTDRQVVEWVAEMAENTVHRVPTARLPGCCTKNR
jgi:hypothetical protein